MATDLKYLDLKIDRKDYFQLVLNGVCVSTTAYRTRLQCVEAYVVQITDQKGIIDFPEVEIPF